MVVDIRTTFHLPSAINHDSNSQCHCRVSGVGRCIGILFNTDRDTLRCIHPHMFRYSFSAYFKGLYELLTQHHSEVTEVISWNVIRPLCHKKLLEVSTFNLFSTVPMPGAGNPRKLGSIPGKNKRLISTPKGTKRPWGPSNLLLMGTGNKPQE